MEIGGSVAGALPAGKEEGRKAMEIKAAPKPLLFYTVAQAAEVVSLSASTLYAEIKAGRLKAKVRKGNKRGYRIERIELMRWFNEEWEETQ